MSQPNPSTALARVVIDELVRHGADFVVVSPGSRSGALAIAALDDARVDARVVIDERSAAFHALGRAKAVGRPAVVISTSGTAPANYLPAVVEADMSLTPLVVVSADRPAELHGVGANQTIDQVGLYGDKVRWMADIPAPAADEDMNDVWRTHVTRAVGAALGSTGRPGPVHLNIAFREPTVPVSDDGRNSVSPYGYGVGGRDGGLPWAEIEPTEPPEPSLELPAPKRGLVIAGEGQYDRDAVRQSARALKWPVLATAMSGMRGHDTVTAYHHILSAGVTEPLRPELVLAIGAIGPDDRLERLVAAARFRFRVDSLGRNIDPGQNATRVLHADPARLLRSVVSEGPSEEWADGWARADEIARSAVDGRLRREPDMSGPATAAALNHVSWDRLVVASSLPVRDVDAQVTRPGTVISNRGASGIDGFVSTALGAASAGGRTVALAGDLSLLHDANGFLCDVTDDLVLVVVDNDGGGLFDSLPQAEHAPHFERAFVTPHGRRPEALAVFHELGYAKADDSPSLIAAVEEGLSTGGRHLIEVAVDRMSDLSVRRALDAAAAEALGSAEL